MGVNEKMTAIADKIRSHTGKTGELGLDDMVTEVDVVSNMLAGKIASRSVTDLYLKDGCSKISSYAFVRNTALKSVTIDKAWIDGIFYEAFYNCTGLEKITCKKVGRIGERAFYNCTAMKVYDFSDCGAVPILDNISAFYGIPDDCVIYVPDNLYDEWIVATNWIDLAEHIMASHQKVWNELIKNGTITMSGTEVVACKKDFSGELVIPDGVTRISDEAFFSCDIAHVTLPSTLATIGDMAFGVCTKLKQIIIPEGTTTIGRYAFVECSNLRDIFISSTVTSIAEGAFSTQVGSRNIGLDPENTTYHLSSNCLIETATKKLIIGNNNSIIPTDGSVTSIGSNAFYGCDFTNINIPKTIVKIGDGAFEYCTELESIDISSVTELGSAFLNCQSLKSVVLSDKLTHLRGATFYNTIVSSIILPNTLTYIGRHVFMECSLARNGIIDYTGTIAQWRKINKEEWWLDVPGMGSKCTIHCIDGDIVESVP